MKIAVMQPYFLPYTGYFHLLDAVDEFVFFDDVNFIKRGWINRNNFLVQGKAHLFSVSLINASQNDLIKDVRINYSEKWKDNFIKILKFNYSKANNFAQVFSVIENRLASSYESIADLNIALIRAICEYLGLNKRFDKSSAIDYDRKGTGQEKILSICSLKNADNYINPIGGTELYDKAHFSQARVQLNFVESGPVVYTQFVGKEFVPHLSFLDVLMFCEVPEVLNLLKQYSLK